MKKLLLIFGAIILIYGCQKQTGNEQITDKWNGYESFYKAGDITRPLFAGQTINVGTVTYGIDVNANFYVTYTTTGGWTMSETHMYAGTWANMPKNKPGHPKIGQFPWSTIHNPMVTSFTYRIPLTSLPPCDEPGFIVATHAVVKNGGQCETAWGDWKGTYTNSEGESMPCGKKFADNGWGGYNTYYYNEPAAPHTLLYGTGYSNGYLSIYLIDATSGLTTEVSREAVGGQGTTYDGAAWDPETTNLLYTSYNSANNTNELWVNQLDETTPAYLAGTLDGSAKSATFYENQFYYVDSETNDIKVVTFTGTDTWTISNETFLSSIPSSIVVNDLAMNPTGSTIYIIGVYNTNTQLFKYDIATDTYTLIDNINLANDAQITFGSDDNLYATSSSGTGSTIVSQLNPTTGTVISNEDHEVPGGGTVGDITKAPIQ